MLTPDQISAVQSALTAAGYTCEANGVWDEATRLAYAGYGVSHNLTERQRRRMPESMEQVPAGLLSAESEDATAKAEAAAKAEAEAEAARVAKERAEAEARARELSEQQSEQLGEDTSGRDESGAPLAATPAPTPAPTATSTILPAAGAGVAKASTTAAPANKNSK